MRLPERHPVAVALAAFAQDGRRQVLAALVRATGSLGVAEDALQDATVRALERWPVDGVPEVPAAWLQVTARRRAVDLLRRERMRTGKELDGAGLMPPLAAPEESGPVEAIDDDQLRLIFTCCHPSLAPQTRLALALRHLCGFEVAEVARALLSSEAATAKRLTRARRKIVDAGIPYRVPPAEELPGRLDDVLATIYLLFNEGYSASAGPDHVRADLCAAAIRLARAVVRLLPGNRPPLALLSLLLLQDARRAARTTVDGSVVLLRDQDRSRWDAAAIAEGTAIAAALIRSGADPHPYLVQAAIAACHSTAATWADTDWTAILAWYDVLVTVEGSPAARLARAVARSEGGDPAGGYAEASAITGLESYPPWHAVLGDLLDRLGRPRDARLARSRALALPVSEATSRHLSGLITDD